MQQIVMVSWQDAISRNGWAHLPTGGEAPLETGAMPCVSVGVLIESTDEHVTLAQSISGHAVAELLSIPKGMVTEVKTLRRLDSRLLQ